MANILVTGGAGFIGSFLVDGLIKKGHSVKIIDNLTEQVHHGKAPGYLNKEAEFVNADVNDTEALYGGVKDSEIIFHQAAAVGVGQSMYEILQYVKANTLGTANLLDILVNKKHNVKKVIVASSMSAYGEGAYLTKTGERLRPSLRSTEQMEKGEWELKDPKNGEILKPVGVKESDNFFCNSIYAITKMDQEEMTRAVCKAYGIPSVALRYFNVFGPRQSLSNPYTGVAAIFMSRLKNDKQPIIYEDGLQSRDFVSVHDIVKANMLSMEKSAADNEVFNVGTGNPLSILEISEVLARLHGKDIKADVTNKFRKGDVRHCFADITKIKKKLGFEPSVSFEDGMKELAEWSRDAEAVDKFDEAAEELKKHKLI